MISVIIVDDEQPAREELEFLLKKIPDVTIVGIAEGGYEALHLIDKSTPDLVFLDIKMPEMNGFEVAESIKLQDKPPGIIFTTAYDRYAIQAFDINALDYILKPISLERLEKSINRYLLQKPEPNDTDFDSINKLINKISRNDSFPKYITLPKGEHFKPILIDDIVAVSAEGRAVNIMAQNGNFQYMKSITFMEDLLKSNIFFRCHRSYIININHIVKIDIWFNNTYQLEMKGVNEKIPVSRSYISRFREIMAIM